MSRIQLFCGVSFALFLWSAIAAATADEPAKDPGHEQRKPKVFAIIFNMGYGGDNLPKDKAEFEKLAVACKEAHYNVILGKYEDWREEICRKHGLLMFVDLLVADHHVYRGLPAEVPKAKALCEKLKGNDAIYGYHLWSDVMKADGRSRDIANVHTWDPTHPTYCGSYRMKGNSGLVNPDLHGYYDFHFIRGGLWGHLNSAWNVSRSKDAYFLIYMAPAPGKIGIGNYNRLAYTDSVSIAYGLKGYLYHYAGGYAGDGKWDAQGQDLAKANGNVAPLGPELMKIGNPTDIYSTPMTVDSKNREHFPAAIPAGFKPVPADYWAQVEAGEVLIGAFKDDQKRDAAVLANHNIYMAQKMKLKAKDGKKVELFDRATKAWKVLNPADGTVTFDIEPGSFELIHAAN
ncbi:MAG: hypothetical protein K8T91_14530 [Planctomycetes bacterium]|nr:hypothetical protein [Planctomycetota bacterium]